MNTRMNTGASPGGDALKAEPDAPPGGARHRVAVDVAVVLGVLLALGVLCGVLWWLLVDPAEYTKTAGGGAMGESELGKQFNADGWYVAIAVVDGLVAGCALSWWRSRDPLLTTVLLVVGAAVAAMAMAVTGHLLGPGDPDVALRAAKAGQHVAVPLSVAPQVSLLGVNLAVSYLAWPIAVLIGALTVLWSNPKKTSGLGNRDLHTQDRARG